MRVNASSTHRMAVQALQERCSAEIKTVWKNFSERLAQHLFSQMKLHRRWIQSLGSLFPMSKEFDEALEFLGHNISVRNLAENVPLEMKLSNRSPRNLCLLHNRRILFMISPAKGAFSCRQSLSLLGSLKKILCIPKNRRRSFLEVNESSAALFTPTNVLFIIFKLRFMWFDLVGVQPLDCFLWLASWVGSTNLVHVVRANHILYTAEKIQASNTGMASACPDGFRPKAPIVCRPQKKSAGYCPANTIHWAVYHPNAVAVCFLL